MTPVIFRKWGPRNGGDVIALFPTVAAGQYGNCNSYEHVGQHGGANYSYVVSATKPAKPEEYADLLAELKAIGYDDLKVYQRESPWMHRERMEGWKI